MKSTPTPYVATGRTTEALSLTVGSAGSHFQCDVFVPAGTRCKKLDGGSDPWVVADLGFIKDKHSFVYSEASIYGIRVPEAKITDIKSI